jgi:hypothetical protein
MSLSTKDWKKHYLFLFAWLNENTCAVLFHKQLEGSGKVLRGLFRICKVRNRWQNQQKQYGPQTSSCTTFPISASYKYTTFFITWALCKFGFSPDVKFYTDFLKISLMIRYIRYSSNSTVININLMTLSYNWREDDHMGEHTFI